MRCCAYKRSHQDSNGATTPKRRQLAHEPEGAMEAKTPELFPELWRMVFTYLPPCLVQVLKLVCKQWNDLTPRYPPNYMPTNAKAWGFAPPAYPEFRSALLYELTKGGYADIIRDYFLHDTSPPPPYVCKLTLCTAIGGNHLDVFTLLYEEMWKCPDTLNLRDAIIHECLSSPHDTVPFMGMLPVTGGVLFTMSALPNVLPNEENLIWLALHPAVSLSALAKHEDFWRLCGVYGSTRLFGMLTRTVQHCAYVCAHWLTQVIRYMVFEAIANDRVCFVRHVMRSAPIAVESETIPSGIDLLPGPTSLVLWMSKPMMKLLLQIHPHLFHGTSDQSTLTTVPTEADLFMHALNNPTGPHVLWRLLEEDLVTVPTSGLLFYGMWDINAGLIRARKQASGIARNLLWLWQEHRSLVPWGQLTGKECIRYFNAAITCDDPVPELQAAYSLYCISQLSPPPPEVLTMVTTGEYPHLKAMYSVAPQTRGWAIVDLFRSTPHLDAVTIRWVMEQEWLRMSMRLEYVGEELAYCLGRRGGSAGIELLTCLMSHEPMLPGMRKNLAMNMFRGAITTDTPCRNHRVCAWVCREFPEWREEMGSGTNA